MTAGPSGQWTPYCGVAPFPDDIFTRWNLDPFLIVAIPLAAWLMRRAGARRDMAGGALALAVFLFISPFCALSSALFSARVAHHIALTAVLAPLAIHAMPPASRWPGSLGLWTGLQALTFWFWHAPGVYAQALSSDVVYWSMQASLFATAAGFWMALKHSASLPATAALLFTTVQMGLLGALITFAGAPLYAPHAASTAPWGLTALEDQQLAGLIMWGPAAALYLAAGLLLASRWLTLESKREPAS